VIKDKKKDIKKKNICNVFSKNITLNGSTNRVVHVSLTTCYKCHEPLVSTTTGTNVDSVRICQWAARLNQVVKMHGVRIIGRGAVV
jgi:hypothetical protein